MRNQTKKIVALLMTLVMCFATIAPMAVFAADTTLPEIVYWEDFTKAQAEGKLNTSGSDRTIATKNGFFINTTPQYEKDENGKEIKDEDHIVKETHYSVENGTLKYSSKVESSFFDIRFSRGSIMEKNLMQDFVLSMRVKPSVSNLSAQFSLSGRYEHSATLNANQNGPRLNGGKFYAGSTAKSEAIIPANKWSYIEIVFHYNENVMPTNPVLGKGAIDSYSMMFNGEVIFTQNLPEGVLIKSYDFFRMFSWTNDDNLEIDDIRVALGTQSLKVFDENGGVKAADYTQSFSWLTESQLDPVPEYAYSFCVVGDTQILNMDDYKSRTPDDPTYSSYNGVETNYMATLYDWIVANAKDQKMAQVIGLGDITDDNTDLEWQIAWDQITKMDGVVPYSLVRGNHDPGNEYNATFAGNTAYTSQFEGFYEAGKLENSYKRFEVAGHKYLLMTLDFGPVDAVLDWANGVIASYPDHKVIITTHAYLSEDGDTQKAGVDADLPSKNGNDQKNDGNEMWDKLVSKHENVFMVLSGHIDTDYLVCTQSEGDHGNTVTQLLVDPQGLDEEVGSTSMVTMLYFSEDGETITVRTYSTVHDMYFAQENQFTIDANAEIVDNSNTIYSNSFDSMDGINTASIGSGIFGLQHYGKDPGKAEIVDGALKLTENTSQTDCIVGFRPYQGNDLIKNLTYDKDLRLSFKVRAEGGIDLGQFICRDQSISGTSEVFMKISKGNILVDHNHDGTFTTYGTIVGGEWNTFDIIFHYDTTDKQYDTYTIIFNGKSIGTFAFADATAFAKLDRFELFRYLANGKSAEIDDFYYGFHKNIDRVLNKDSIYAVDFKDATDVPTKDAPLNNFRAMNGYVGHANSYVKNDILTVTAGTQGDSFVDINPGKNFGYVGNMTLSLKVRPVGSTWNGNYFLAPRYNTTSGGTADNKLITQGYQNQLKIGDKVAELSLYRMNTVDVTFQYDYSKMIYTSASLYVNGTYVGSTDITAWNCTQINWFRGLYAYYVEKGWDLESVTLAQGCQVSYKGETTVTDFIGSQVSEANDGKYSVRLLAVMTDADVSKYENVGFKVQIKFADGSVATMPDELGVCKEVYSSVDATVGIKQTYTAADLGGKSIFALNCKNLLITDGAATFTVTTYYTLAGEETVMERTWELTVDPATDIPVQEAN